MAIISNAVTIADAGAFSVGLGSKVHIKTLTASSSATLSLVHGADSVVLDSTYPIYQLEFINIHPASNGGFQMNLSTDSGSNYNVTKTSSGFQAYHREDGSASLLGGGWNQLEQSTAYQVIAGASVKNDADSGVSGLMNLFNPSSTTFVKHYMTTCSSMDTSSPPYVQTQFSAGYANTTSAVNAISFKWSTGNIDSGKIKLYGIKDS